MQTVFIETTIPSYYTDGDLAILFCRRGSNRTLNGGTNIVSDTSFSPLRLSWTRRAGAIQKLRRSERSFSVAFHYSTSVISSLRWHRTFLPLGSYLTRLQTTPTTLPVLAFTESIFLLTWNYTHIANPHNQRRIKERLARHGLEMPPCTPEELIADYGHDDIN